MAPGRGRVDLFAVGERSGKTTTAGGGVDLEHRIGRRGAVFTRGWIGAAWDDPADRRLEAGILGGIRLAW